MTSKESLKCIILGTNVDTYRSSIEEIDKAIETIEKDLEILEILKKHMSISNDYHFDNNSEECIECILIEDLTIRKEEYDKIKEWLEND